MATPVILPKQGQSVETCILTEWYKKKGDPVKRGDLLFAYETDKSSFEEEAKADGVLLEVYFQEGDEVPVLTEVAVIGEAGEKVEAASPATGKTESSPAADKPESAPAEEDSSDAAAKEKAATQESASEVIPEDRKKIRISPRARKMAEVKGIPLEGISGSGPQGRIIVRDIEDRLAGPEAAEAAAAGEPATAAEVTAAEKGAPAAAEIPEKPYARAETKAPSGPPLPKTAPVTSGEWEDRPLSNMRRLIAGAMHASLQNSAQLTHHLSADARSILSLRKKVKKQMEEGSAVNITLNNMICFAVIRALKKHPGANVHFLGESIRYFRKIHLGMAVDTERGLMVPVLRNADDLSLAGLSSQAAQLAAACRSGKIDPDLLQPDSATFTVSNLGNYGVEMFTPVINLPQAAILGVNTILERPARMEDGTFGFVPYVGLSLTYDHRALDGGPATLFLAEIKNEIEQFNHELINL